MPATTIEIRRRYTPDQESALIDAVHAALVEGLQIPQDDRTLRLVVHEPHRFSLPATKGDRYTLVTIDLFSGRSLAAKKALYQAVVRNLGALDIPPDHVTVVLHEVPAENWGIRGGQAASEVDLGFKVEV